MAENTVAITNPPAKYKSKVWVNFGFLKGDNTKVVCRICKTIIKFCGNTTNLNTHLTRHHSGDCLNSSAKTASSTCGEVQGRQCQHPTIDSAFQNKLSRNSKRATEITDSVTRFIIQDLQPYSVVEDKGFKHMLSILEPRYTIPGRHYFADTAVPQLYKSVKDDIQLQLRETSRVAITSDGWTSNSTQSYVTITVHFINDLWELCSFVLQTREMAESHTGSNLAQVLLEAVDEWQIKDKQPALVSDNASNMILAGRETGFTPHVGCFAHTLNLASQKVMKITAVSKLLARVKRIVTFFRKSTKASTILKDKQVLLGLPKHRLKQDVCTRWNSALDMLDRVLEQQAAIVASLLEKDLRSRDKDINTLSEADITLAEDIVKVLTPMKTATTVMSDEQLPTLSILSPLYHQILEDMTPDSNDSPTVKNIKIAINQDLQNRYTNVMDVFNRASALDPRFKSLPFLTEGERHKVFYDLTVEVEHNNTDLQSTLASPMDPAISDDTSNANTSTATDPNQISSNSSSDDSFESPRKVCKIDPTCALSQLFGHKFVNSETSNKKTKSLLERATDEVANYKKEPSLSLNSNPLNWWKEHSTLFPLLSNLANQYLCIPASSVPSERVFSTAGDIITAKRSCLKPKHVDELIFLKKNYS
ncbi:hypothetical protein SNE40_001613 [Patella caerulea]|uniref:BED-type domain-containing protein n=1 Tax=Patella caerulea TaxID=87958 RepID=A0AAN8Q372_PATCE